MKIHIVGEYTNFRQWMLSGDVFMGHGIEGPPASVLYHQNGPFSMPGFST